MCVKPTDLVLCYDFQIKQLHKDTLVLHQSLFQLLITLASDHQHQELVNEMLDSCVQYVYSKCLRKTFLVLDMRGTGVKGGNKKEAGRE